MQRRKGVLIALLTAVLLVAWGLSFPVSAHARTTMDNRGIQNRLAQHVRHQLLMLPYYGVFDNLQFKVVGVDSIVLSGQVTRPALKSDAERSILKLEGVRKVVNDIEVLPLSPYDDRLRIAEYRRIFSMAGLFRYSEGAVPSIHIIVKNGNVSLVGVVSNRSDKNLAEIAANEVPGVFSVTNELAVEGA
jgi:osmotically-inducible protein OsmY